MTTIDLGERLATVRVTYAWRIMSLLPLSLWGLLVLFICLILREPVKKGEALPMLLVTVVLIALPLWVWWWHKGISVSFHDKGIIRGSGKRAVAIAYSDIVEVWYRAVTQIVNGVNIGTNYYATIRGSGGARIKLSNNLTGGWETIMLALTKIVEYQIPAMQAALTSGCPIRFGPIEVDSSGVRRGSNTIAWHELQPIKVNEDMLILRGSERRPTIRLRFSRIPNAHAFMLLCAKRTEHKETDRVPTTGGTVRR